MKALYFTASSSSGDKRWEKGVGGGGRKELVFRRKEYEAWERVGDYFNASKENSNDARLERF